MKVFTPEISWHQKEPIFSVDFCNSTWKLASAGADFTIKIWQLKEDEDGNVGLDFLANLDRHSKPVNCVRFSPDGKYLASAGDDCIIIIWKLSEDDDDQMASEPSFGSEEIVNKERWTVHKMLRRGHLEDIYDLAWSPNGTQLVSGSVDNSAIIWDVDKGHFTNIIKDHKHYVQGVCWDPRGQYIVTHSSDRSCKVYSISKNKCVHTIHKSTFPTLNPTEESPKQKSSKLFLDETMQSFFRRCRFSPDGLLLALPGGIYESGEKSVKATYVYTRGGFSKPALCLPVSKKASIGVCFCPVIFDNMEVDEGKENRQVNESMIKLPYRMCYAVATLDSVLFYDTQHPYPFGFVSNVHYASLTDVAWSSDGRIVVVSSLDGYCSIISFEEGELGKPSSINPMEYVSSKLKAKREAKKEAKQVQSENKSSVVDASEKEKEQNANTRPSSAPAKDQATLHQFVTPVRKRKRNQVNRGSPHTPPTRSPLSKTPNGKMASDRTLLDRSPVVDNRSPESPIDLAGSPQSLPMSSPQTEEHNSDQVPSTAKTTRTPKRANLISLGFRPISKPSGDTSSTDDGKNSTTTTTRNDPPQQAQVSSENQKKTPKRVNLMNIANFKTATVPSSDKCNSQENTSESEKSGNKESNAQPISTCGASNQPIKPPRRVSIVSLSGKRNNSGALKEADDMKNSVETSANELNTVTSNDRNINLESLNPSLKSPLPPRRVEIISLLEDSPKKASEPKDGFPQETAEGSTVKQVTSTSQIHAKDSQPSGQEIFNAGNDSQSGSSPGGRAPRRMGFVTLVPKK